MPFRRTKGILTDNDSSDPKNEADVIMTAVALGLAGDYIATTGKPLQFDRDPLERDTKKIELFTDTVKKMDVAVAANDHATQSFLKWFIDEQVEEEANVEKILATLKLINGQGNGIFMMDRELSQRVFVNPNTAV